jgi:hypothetical protein
MIEVLLPFLFYLTLFGSIFALVSHLRCARKRYLEQLLLEIRRENARLELRRNEIIERFNLFEEAIVLGEYGAHEEASQLVMKATAPMISDKLD